MAHGGFYEAALPESATAVVNHRLLPGDSAAKVLERDARIVREALPPDLQHLCHVTPKEDSNIQDASNISSSARILKSPLYRDVVL